MYWIAIVNFFVLVLDLIGVCIEIGDIEVCGNSTARTEIAKREIVLIDTSMATVGCFNKFLIIQMHLFNP